MEGRKPLVFIVNNANQHDYSKAERFGTLVSVTQGNVNVFRASRLLWEIKEVMKQYTAGDYVLVTGHSIINILAVIDCLLKSRQINLLLYGARLNDYALTTIEISFWPLLDRALRLYSKFAPVVDELLEMDGKEIKKFIALVKEKPNGRKRNNNKISKSVP